MTLSKLFSSSDAQSQLKLVSNDIVSSLFQIQSNDRVKNVEIMKKNNFLQADGTLMTDMSTRYFPKMLEKYVLIASHVI